MMEKTDLKNLVKKATVEKPENNIPDPEIFTVEPISKPKSKGRKTKKRTKNVKVKKPKEDKKSSKTTDKIGGKEETPPTSRNGKDNREKRDPAGILERILERILPPWY